MSVFQYSAVVGLVTALTWELVTAFRRRTLLGMWLPRALTYSTAAVMIIFPGLVQQFAGIVGIHRGSDLVMYTFVLLFVFLAFLFYGRLRHLELHVTRLIRRDAIEHARHGAEPRARLEKPAGPRADDPGQPVTNPERSEKPGPGSASSGVACR